MANRRVGLVLGAGGVTGGAFHAGVLAALEDAGWDPRTADLIVGTSAGSVAAAALRAGLAAGDMVARATNRPLSPPGARLLAGAVAPAPPPRLPPGADEARRRRMAAPEALVNAARRPWAVRPSALLAAALPAGTLPHEYISTGVGSLFHAGWPAEPLWICAVRLADASRVVFGSSGGPIASVGDAVAASCSIPAIFRPVEIGGHRYVDGGAHSPTNLDLVAGEHFDVVVVSSPMSYTGRRLPLGPDGAIRQFSRTRLAAEARAVRRRGIPLLVFQPTEDDRRVMGANAMDPSRQAPTAQHAHESARRRLERDDVRGAVAILTR